MLEDELPLPRHAGCHPRRDQAAVLEPVQRVLDVFRVCVEELLQGGRPEHPSHHRGQLDGVLVLRRKEIDARRQDGLHGVGDRDVLDLRDGPPPVSVPHDLSGVDELRDDLLEVEGVPLGSFQDPVVDRWRELLDREQRGD